MSYYISGSKESYRDYLKSNNLTNEMQTSFEDTGRRVFLKISQPTREAIASVETLSQEKIHLLEFNSDLLTEGFEQYSYRVDNITSGNIELNPTFHWKFCDVIASLGRMNDSLELLLTSAKTPVQTTAFNHFEIARDAFRQELYQDCIDELEKAIYGDHNSTGYKLEWRFHVMKGLLHLGFSDCDLSLVDLPKAEESFLFASRYAKTDFPEEAGRALLCAGWAAYCQGKMKEALTYTEQGRSLNPRMGEAFFQTAKILMSLGNVDSALPVLSRAIERDRFYAFKAAGDGDFQKFDEVLRQFLESLKLEKYRLSLPRVSVVLDKFRFWIENCEEAKNNEAINRVKEFVTSGAKSPLFDILGTLQKIALSSTELQVKVSETSIIKTRSVMEKREVTEEYAVEESYQEEVIIRPAGFLRKQVTEVVTKTRTIMKTRKNSYEEEKTVYDIYTGYGKLLFADVCFVEGGSFDMGNKSGDPDERPAHRVTLSSFLISRNQLTVREYGAYCQATGTSMPNTPDWGWNNNDPIVNVSWNDAQGYCKWAGVRLPTEAEWEYAARGGVKTKKFKFSGSNEVDKVGWYDINSKDKLHPVGTKVANELGIYDMSGNVWEWCNDWYDSGYYSKSGVKNPEGPGTGLYRVLRGGSWYTEDNYCQVSNRGYENSNYGNSSAGFRIARDL